MLDALLNILAVIAIIGIGIFVLVVLSDLLLSIIDGKNGIFFKRGNKKRDEEKQEEKQPEVTDYENLPQRPKMVDHQIEEVKEQPTLTYSEPIVEQPDEQDKELDFSEFTVDEHDTKEDDYEKYVEEITEISKSMLEDEVAEKLEENTEAEEVEETEEQQEENNEELENALKELEAQKRAYAELLKEKEQLKKALEEQEENKTTEVALPVESMDELQARLAMLEDRLKTNEKLLKANKKEFLPLFRIHRSLENDKKKLRRKEQILAKQKMVLYGVNNYVDIDEEKAKELGEELDLLEGLKVSVNDATAIMEANKDRYPILEETNRILVQTVEDIKSDIAEVKAKIELLNNNNSEE